MQVLSNLKTSVEGHLHLVSGYLKSIAFQDWFRGPGIKDATRGIHRDVYWRPDQEICVYKWWVNPSD